MIGRLVVGLAAFLGIAVLGGNAALAQGDAAKGKGSYEQFCGSCHGATGKGDGPAAAALNPKPRDLTEKAYMVDLKQDYLVSIVKKGGAAVGKSPLMPAWESAMKDDEIVDVIAFIRTLAK